jgi:hypothetical protein
MILWEWVFLMSEVPLYDRPVPQLWQKTGVAKWRILSHHTVKYAGLVPLDLEGNVTT